MDIQSKTHIEMANLNPSVVNKVHEVEALENATAILYFETFNHNIWLLNVQFVRNDGNGINFQSLNLYQRDTTTLVFNMQDGKVYGFDECDMMRNCTAGVNTPEDFISEILHDLFVQGWA